MKCEIAYLKKRVEELENGSVYTSLIKELGHLRMELDVCKEDSVRLEDIRRLLE